MKSLQTVNQRRMDEYTHDEYVNEHYIRIKVRKNAITTPIESGSTHLHPTIDNLLRAYGLSTRITHDHPHMGEYQPNDRNGYAANFGERRDRTYRMHLLDRRPIASGLIQDLKALEIVEEVEVVEIEDPPKPLPKSNSKWLLLGLLLGALALVPLLLGLNKFLRPPLPPATNPAATFFVNPLAGSDTNNGEAGTPFKTLSHALEQAGPESTIYLAKGDYGTVRPEAIPTDTKLIIQDFNDIEGNWAAPYIRALASQGMLSGYPDGTFRPDESLTRAEYAAMLNKVFNFPAAKADHKFVDLSPYSWAYPYIQRAYASNFLKGFPEGDFRPNDAIPRVQVIAALAGGLGMPQSLDNGTLENTLKVYQDRDLIPAWAQASVAGATAGRIVFNQPDLNMLNPNHSATRGEAAAMIYQALMHQGKMFVPVPDSHYLVKP